MATFLTGTILTESIVETVPKPLRLSCVGRELPDKEFRYLRDRYSYGRRLLASLIPSLALSTLLTFQHWAGVSPILHLSVLVRPVFLINSRLGLFTAAYCRHPPEVTGSFAEFLNDVVLSLTLEFHPNYRVGLRYAAPLISIAAFLESLASLTSLLYSTLQPLNAGFAY